MEEQLRVVMCIYAQFVIGVEEHLVLQYISDHTFPPMIEMIMDIARVLNNSKKEIVLLEKIVAAQSKAIELYKILH